MPSIRVRRIPHLGVLLLITSCGPKGASLTITPGDLDFGTVASTVKNAPLCKGGQSTRNVTVTVNAPNGPVAHNEMMSPGDFHWTIDTLIPNPFPPGRSTWTLSIWFAPTKTGDQTAVASIMLMDPNAPISPIIDLKGRGVCEL